MFKMYHYIYLFYKFYHPKGTGLYTTFYSIENMLEEMWVIWDVMPRQLVSSYISRALCRFKMLVTLYQSTQHNIPEDLNVCRRQGRSVESVELLLSVADDNSWYQMKDLREVSAYILLEISICWVCLKGSGIKCLQSHSQFH
jgi:hypothetical protein